MSVYGAICLHSQQIDVFQAARDELPFSERQSYESSRNRARDEDNKRHERAQGDFDAGQLRINTPRRAT